jgi:hypothetical protein
MLLVVALLFVNTFASTTIAGPRDAQWKQVEEAVKKGLPQTAITNLEPIIQGALKDKAYAEAVKAIGQKIALEGNIQGNKPEEKITRLEAEIAKAPKEMVPLMDTLLAEWYWQYFQQNRWRFMQRTATASQPGKDFTTWDLPRLFAEIDKQFQKAIAAEKILKATPIGAWNDLLAKGTVTGPRSTISLPIRPWISTRPASRRRPCQRTPLSWPRTARSSTPRRSS